MFDILTVIIRSMAIIGIPAGIAGIVIEIKEMINNVRSD